MMMLTEGRDESAVPVAMVVILQGVGFAGGAARMREERKDEEQTLQPMMSLSSSQHNF